MDESLLKPLYEIFENVGIAFGHHHNTKFGVKDFVKCLVVACQTAGTIQSAGTILRMLKGDNAATPKWCRNMMNSITEEDCQNICNNLVDAVTVPGRQPVMPGEAKNAWALDKHDKPRYDKGRFSMKYLRYSQPKSGTYKFESYATMQSVGGKCNVTRNCASVYRLTENVELVSKFIKKLQKTGTPIDELFVDREFFAVDVMSAIDKAGVMFVMPAIKNSRTNADIEACHAGRIDAVSRHTIYSGKDEFTYTQVIVKSKRYDDPTADTSQRYVVFATNAPVWYAKEQIERLPLDYKDRWFIETRYRQTEEVCPWTTSKNHIFRSILFHLAIYMCNIWAVLRLNCGMPPNMFTLQIMMFMAVHAALETCDALHLPPGPKPRTPPDPGG